ncbi:hypothetical protein J6590_052167 [Homalodisca vitripennis]|nr:hypothetical protein J6590_052167 [Homalodisca vitripennis]
MWEDTVRSRGVVIEMWMTQNVLFLVIVSDLEVIHHYTECPPPGHRVRPRGDPSLHWSVGVWLVYICFITFSSELLSVILSPTRYLKNVGGH